MKIVKDGLYMYNDGEDLFIVKATGATHTNNYSDCFEGVLVFDKNGYYNLNHFDHEWDISEFKRLDNKITTGEE